MASPMLLFSLFKVDPGSLLVHTLAFPKFGTTPPSPTLSIMKIVIRPMAITLVLFLALSNATLISAASDDASYYGGTVAAFKDAKKEINGQLVARDETNLQFFYGKNKSEVVAIPYANFIDMEYGQKSGRRVGAAVATTILLGPIGLLTLFSKKQDHFLTLGFKDAEGKEQVAVFKMNKGMVRTFLPILEARSGKKVEYQSKGAEKKATGK
jgi:hypothetical protein